MRKRVLQRPPHRPPVRDRDAPRTSEAEQLLRRQADGPAVPVGDVRQRFDGFFVSARRDEEFGRLLQVEEEVPADEHRERKRTAAVLGVLSGVNGGSKGRSVNGFTGCNWVRTCV